MISNKIKKYMIYVGFECANKYKLAIPKIVVEYTVKKFQLVEKKELISYAINVCKKINKMSDLKISNKLNELRDKRWNK